ncbi:lipopolysaccharide heptosyltransferase II [bacterium]|nr:lipopolysaccharide heptosyltransferase II [bacterium]
MTTSNRAVQRIAVRLTNWVGDCVMNTPFLARLRAIYPDAHIAAWGRRSVTGILQNHPHVDEIRTLDDRTRGGFLAAVRELRRFRADLGFLLPNSLQTAALFTLGGVRRRVGYDRDGRRFLLTDPVRLRAEDLAVHEVRYYLRLLHRFDPAPPVDPPPLLLRVTEEESAGMVSWLAERSIGAGEPVLGVNPAAFFGTAKRWPAERYAEAARTLAEELDCRVVVTGLPQERDVAQAVCDAGGPRFHNGAGEMSLRQLMAFLARCSLFLTNDSGAMHIAAALGTPLVAVFGSTDWVTTAPLSPRARIVRIDTPCAPCLLRHCPIDHRCMTGVTPGMVIEAARQELAKAN